MSKKETKKSEVMLLESKLYSHIHQIRKHKVMLSFDLASLYQVEPKILNQAVKRNMSRFPDDFMFRLTNKEWDFIRSQSVTLNGRGNFPKYLPYAFTEQGVAMLSSVLNSQCAIAVNIQIMRMFVKMRQMVVEYAELTKKSKSLSRDTWITS